MINLNGGLKLNANMSLFVCDKNLVYVSLPKCASSSIQASILKLYDLKLPKIIPKKVQHTIRLVYKNHKTKMRKKEKKEILKDKYIFTFVRNPYKRFFSWYTDKVLKSTELNSFIPKELAFLDNTKIKYTFKDIVRIICLMDNDIIDDHLKSMNYIINKNVDRLNYVGRVENIKEDWEIMKKLYDSNLEDLENKNKSKLKTNTFSNNFDQETADLIYERYKDDFIRFGYDKNSWRETK